jgi:hypothetical protein
MRNLTAQQKKLLREWFNKNYDGGCMFDMGEKIDSETYERIEAIHPTEIHLQNVNHYLEELVNKRSKEDVWACRCSPKCEGVCKENLPF